MIKFVPVLARDNNCSWFCYDFFALQKEIYSVHINEKKENNRNIFTIILFNRTKRTHILFY